MKKLFTIVFSICFILRFSNENLCAKEKEVAESKNNINTKTVNKTTEETNKNFYNLKNYNNNIIESIRYGIDASEFFFNNDQFIFNDDNQTNSVFVTIRNQLPYIEDEKRDIENNKKIILDNNRKIIFTKEQRKENMKSRKKIAEKVDPRMKIGTNDYLNFYIGFYYLPIVNAINNNSLNAYFTFFGLQVGFYFFRLNNYINPFFKFNALLTNVMYNHKKEEQIGRTNENFNKTFNMFDFDIGNRFILNRTLHDKTSIELYGSIGFYKHQNTCAKYENHKNSKGQTYSVCVAKNKTPMLFSEEGYTFGGGIRYIKTFASPLDVMLGLKYRLLLHNDKKYIPENHAKINHLVMLEFGLGLIL